MCACVRIEGKGIKREFQVGAAAAERGKDQQGKDQTIEGFVRQTKEFDF